MRKIVYPAIVQTCGEEQQIRYPDFPACHTAALEDEAPFEIARQALQAHLDAMPETVLPVPSSLATLNIGADDSLIFIAIERK